MRNFSFILILLLAGCNLFKPDELRIGVVDSFFCLNNINYGKLTVFKAYGANSVGVATGEPAKCAQFSKYKKRLHGHLVLKTILDHVDHKKSFPFKINLYPVNIFEKNGSTSKDNWLKAIEYLKNNKVQ
jgi:hypothetical protein